MSRAILVTLAAGVVLATAGPAAANRFGRDCVTVSPDSMRARTAALTTAYTTDGFEMRRQRGDSTCSFERPGRGVCRLRHPGMVHVRTARTDAWFDVPRGWSAQIVVRNGAAHCRLS